SVARAQIAPSSRCGRNSEPMIPLKLRYAEAARAAAATAKVIQRKRMAHSSVLRYAFVSHVITGLRHSRAFAPKRKLERAGAMSIENMSDPSSAKDTVQAIGLNRRPSTRCKVKIGIYAVMMMLME